MCETVPGLHAAVDEPLIAIGNEISCPLLQSFQASVSRLRSEISKPYRKRILSAAL